MFCQCFFFNDTATTEIYTLSLHDALPIWLPSFQNTSAVLIRGDLKDDYGVAVEDITWVPRGQGAVPFKAPPGAKIEPLEDRKSTRLNSSHANISYAVFCLKKKK